jgi:tRNA (cytosine38-C5)-methyltransferase
VITPLHHRSACFTHSYAKFVRGTGSILYTGPLDAESNNTDEVVKTNRKRDRTTAFLTSTIFNLEAPDGRSFDADWSKDIDWVNEMRYLSGTEIARLMGFPVAGKSASTGDDAIDKSFREFNFPATTTLKQQWKLLGNSLNVKVAGKVAEIGMSVLFTQ